MVVSCGRWRVEFSTSPLLTYGIEIYDVQMMSFLGIMALPQHLEIIVQWIQYDNPKIWPTKQPKLDLGYFTAFMEILR